MPRKRESRYVKLSRQRLYHARAVLKELQAAELPTQEAVIHLELSTTFLAIAKKFSPLIIDFKRRKNWYPKRHIKKDS